MNCPCIEEYRLADLKNYSGIIRMNYRRKII